MNCYTVLVCHSVCHELSSKPCACTLRLSPRALQRWVQRTIPKPQMWLPREHQIHPCTGAQFTQGLLWGFAMVQNSQGAGLPQTQTPPSPPILP